MKEINHSLAIQAPPEKIFQALTTKNGLSGWWTKNLEVTGTVGSISTFRFKSGAFNKMKIIYTESDFIEWLCVDGHDEWKGTHITFELDNQGEETKVCFSHFGFKEQTKYVGECSFHWACYLFSLKNFCETGKGMPNEGN
jgi:uncharacterized protein YndB with AHSA1/START domain